MKAPNYYAINPYVGVVRDAPREKSLDAELAKRFRDALVLFRARVEVLGNIDHVTTADEGESMTVMLEALLEGKRRLVGDEK
ncbi:MAG: hypothetical protein RL641_212 [Candidatus Parcubacteria bacterium]|jgi:hypothetical protein